MATFKECPECGNPIRTQNIEYQEQVILITCPECNLLVEIWNNEDEED
jgi:hypothetical protein